MRNEDLLLHIQQVVKKILYRKVLEQLLTVYSSDEDYNLLLRGMEQLFGDKGWQVLFLLSQTDAEPADYERLQADPHIQEDFLDWFWELAMVHGPKLAAMVNRAMAPSDWDQVRVTKLEGPSGWQGYRVEVTRNDTHQMAIEADRVSLLNLISSIVGFLHDYSRTPLSKDELPVRERIRNTLDKFDDMEEQSETQ